MSAIDRPFWQAGVGGLDEDVDPYWRIDEVERCEIRRIPVLHERHYRIDVWDDRRWMLVEAVTTDGELAKAMGRALNAPEIRHLGTPLTSAGPSDIAVA